MRKLLIGLLLLTSCYTAKQPTWQNMPNGALVSTNGDRIFVAVPNRFLVTIHIKDGKVCYSDTTTFKCIEK